MRNISEIGNRLFPCNMGGRTKSRGSDNRERERENLGFKKNQKTGEEEEETQHQGRGRNPSSRKINQNLGVIVKK